MPFVQQAQTSKQNEYQNTINMIEVLWDSLNYTFEEYMEVDLIGVTWINDFQFIINIDKFSKYISMNKNAITKKLKDSGFSNLGIPSIETFKDVEIAPSSEWKLYMRDGFTPNSDSEIIDEIAFNN